LITSEDPLVGTTVAHYEILAKLGGGGMGVVYAARDTKLGRRVALKFLPPQWSHDDDAKQRFIREAQAASAADHRNICTIHDIASTADGRLFIVMAHYDGQTIKQKLESGPIEIETAVEIAAQVAEGLAHAHANGIVHRDIKPGNLMVSADGVKILDFGLAKFATSLQLTIEGSTIGTAAYMSPEQVRGQEADARSDLWSLGVVLYEMLAGRVPFFGAYPEAVSYAILNEPPPALRALRPDVPEALEQLVFRALHKEPAVRFQNARDVARALRTLQGRTITDDLLTEPLPIRPPTLSRARQPSRLRRIRGRALAAGVMLVLVAAGVYAWLNRAPDRIPVAVVPVVNQTGYPELDPYRLALTQALITELADSPNIRVVPYSRLLQIVRRFLAGGADISSREAVRAITTYSGAQVIVVPSLVYENGAWRARADFQDAATATSTGVTETAPVTSSLAKDTAYGLVAAIASAIHGHFSGAPDGETPVRAASARLRTLDAAAAFEAGLNAYEELEYAEARAAFARAVEQDSRYALGFAWLARVSQVLRQADAAADAADRAARLLSDDTSRHDALFVQAVLAEARRDASAAEGRYRELIEAFPDDPEPLMELAGFQDRQGQNSAAITTLRQALDRDEGLARADLDLCRLYNRLNDPANARRHADLALSKYRALGAAGGEAQALLCLTDVLRVGSREDQQQADRTAAEAVAVFQKLKYAYNLPRAYNYAALAAEAQGDVAQAAGWWESALAAARDGGNVVLEPLVLMNLGATQEKLGHRPQAVRYLRESYARFEALGDEARAAENQYNLGSVLIDYGGNLDEGRRNVDNAIAVFRKLGNRNFEIAAAQTTARYYRYIGRHGDAERELNRAIALARERNLDYEVSTSTIRQAESRFDVGKYVESRNLLLAALPRATGRDRTEATILLARVRAKLGDVAGAETDLAAARAAVERGGDTGLLPLLYMAAGEQAYEAGRRDALAQFARASVLWRDDMPDPASVEARAYAGLLEALAGQRQPGRESIRASLERAAKLGHLSLEARSRVFLARIDVLDRRFADALQSLDAVPADDAQRTIGGELRAQVQYWRGAALDGAGDASGAAAARAAARALVAEIQATIEEPFKDRFMARPDIRPLFTGEPVRISTAQR
jgi:tetratricopeptide (TPR) repeat protein